LTATVGQGVLAGVAADCRDKGMTAKETYEYVTGLRQYVQHCIIPNDLFYLKKGGRISSATAMVGTMLSIKPIITFDAEGKLEVVEKCAGMKKAFSKVIECMSIAPISSLNKVVVVHTNNYKGAEELALLIESKMGIKPSVAIMGPVIGSHVGPGSVSCCWISDKRRDELFY
jgi:DegV family protein with EDD domain